MPEPDIEPPSDSDEHATDDELRAIIAAMDKLASLVPFQRVLGHAETCDRCGARFLELADG